MMDARRFVAAAVSLCIVLLSPGLASYAAAADLEGPAGKGAITPLPLITTNVSGLKVPGAEGLAVPGAELGAIPALPQVATPAALETPAAGVNAAAELGAQALPGSPAAKAQALAKLGENLKPQLEAAGAAENADPRETGESIERLIEGAAPFGGGRRTLDAEHRPGSDVLPAAELPNPAGFYAHAYPIALAKAAELGKKPEQVYFYQASASVPGVDGAAWKFAFYITEKPMTDKELAAAKPASGDIVYVDFRKESLGGRGVAQISDDPHLDSYLDLHLAGQTKFAAPRSYAPAYEAPQVSVFRAAPFAADWVPFTADPTYFKMGSQSSAQGALDSARADGLKGAVSVAFKLRAEPVSGDKDYWYEFHGDRGVSIANGRSGEQRWLTRAPEASAEAPSARLARYVARGKGAGLAAGLVAAAAIWHGVTHIDMDSELGFKAYIMSMLFTPAMMLFAAAGLTALGGKIAAWLSGVKAPKLPVAQAPKPAAPRTNEAEGREAGEWVGGLLTVAGAMAGYFSFGSVSALFSPIWAMLLASAFPFVGVGLILGFSALGGWLGRRKDQGKAYKPGIVASGALGGLATVGGSALIAWLTGLAWPAVIMTLAAVESAASFAGLIAAAVKGRGTIDFKNDPLARGAAVSGISGVASAAAFAALATWLSFAIAGTLKDAAGAKTSPLTDGIAPLYAQAQAAAFKAAQAKGYRPHQLAFAEAESLSPLDAKRGWSFEFVARKSAKDAKGEVIRATVYPQADGRWSASAHAYGEAEIPADSVIGKLTPSWVKQGARAAVGPGLDQAAFALAVPHEELGLSVRLVKERAGAGAEIYYVFDAADGRRYAVNARTGFGREWSATGVDRARIDAAAKSAASYKGRPWSQTEYNMEQSMIEGGLRKAGASPAQIRLYYELCAAAPVRGGSFNPWSGD